MIVKVKEPQPEERRRLRAGQILFTYLHLAPDPEQTEGARGQRRDLHRLRDGHAADGGLPLLAPMSEVAGRMSIQAGAHFLEKPHGGKGILLGGVPGVAPGKVVILGRRRGRHACGDDRGRHGRGCHRARSQSGRACARCGGSSVRR